MRWKDGVVTALDQAWLSLLNLVISVSFVRLASKDDFGLYLVLIAPISLIQGIQNALFLSPLATILPVTESKRRHAVVRTTVSAQALFLIFAGALGAVALVIFQRQGSNALTWWIPASFALAIGGVLAREGSRALFYSSQEPSKALRSDLIYGVGILVGLAILTVIKHLTAAGVLLITGIAALWPYVFEIRRINDFSLDREVLTQFWTYGRWALIGALITWVNLNAYSWIVGVRLNLSAVADINTARLFLVPVGLLIVAWSNLYRPKISALMGKDSHNEIRRLSIQSIVLGLLLLGAFAFILFGTYPQIELYLGREYQGLLPLIFWWSAFFGLTFTRTVLMATLMTEENGYKILQQISWIILCFSGVGIWEAASLGAVWVIACLGVIELVQILMIGRRAVAYWAGVK